MSKEDSAVGKRTGRILEIRTNDEERKTRLKLYPDFDDFKTKRFQCTVCLEVIGTDIFSKSSVYSHPHLNVLVCKACYKFYGNGEFSVDEDGSDKYCRWCGQGGNLYVCADCPVAFCKKCIKQNLPRSILREIEKDDWKCFICNPKPLYELRATCWAVKHYIKKHMKVKKTNDKKQEKNHNNDSCLSSKLKSSNTLNEEELLDFSIFEFVVEGQCVEENKLAHMFLQTMGHDVKMVGHRLSKIMNIYAEKYVRENEEPKFKNIERAVKGFNKTIIHTIQALQEFRETMSEYMVKYKENVNTRLKAGSPVPELILVDESTTKYQMETEEVEVNRLSDSEKEKENKVESNLEEPNSDTGSKNKFILRVRNVDELNKVISEDKEGNLFVIKDENGKCVVDDNVDKDNKDDCKELVDKNKGKKKRVDSETIEILDSDEKVGTEKSKRSENDSLQSSNNNSDDKTETKETIPEKSLNKNMEESKKINGDLSDTNISKSDEEKESAKNLLLKSSSDGSLSDSEGSLDPGSSEETKQRTKKLSKSRKKLRTDKENKVNLICTSSEDEIDRLLNMSSLNKKRKLASEESDNSSSGKNSSSKEQVKKENPPSVKKKRKDSQSSLAEFLKSGENSDSSAVSEENLVLKDSTPPQFDMGSIARMALEATSNPETGDSDIMLSDEEKKKKTPEDMPNDLGINIWEKMKECKSFQKETCSCNAIIESISLVNTDSDDDENSNSSGSTIKKNPAWKRDKLLNEKLSDTDSSMAEEKLKKHKAKLASIELSSSDEDIFVKKESTPRKKKMVRRALKSSSESSSSGSCYKSPSSDSESCKSDESMKKIKQKKRKRIQRVTESDDSEDGDPKITDSGGKGRKNIRKLLKEESLDQSTQAALKEEQERKKRIAERQKLYNKMMECASEENDQLDKLVLDFDPETKKELVSVDKDLVKLMKPHQAEGIKFMWDACYESLKDAKKSKGSGCILAHCMGLGKSFQVVSLVHTLLTTEETGVRTVIVVCPLSTVLNWVNEFNKWLKGIGSSQDVEVFHMTKTPANYRSYKLKEWHKSGGVMILGYNLYRSMAVPKPTAKIKANVKKVFAETLLDPGPDLVICDEGHVLKNESTALSNAMSKIRTLRRIVLTGTPLQNNLVEYHCMVQFVKPNLLGTKKEFKNQFVHPIQNGQFEDSTPHDVKVMKRRAHVLHKILDGIVQRKDYRVLKPYLPMKYEYVISLLLSESQCKLYQYYLDNLARGGRDEARKGATLFSDWQCLSRICTHPRVLLMHSIKAQELKEEETDESDEGSLKNFIVNGSDSSSEGSNSSSSSSIQSIKSDVSMKKLPKKSTRTNPIDVIEPEAAPARPERNQWWSDLIEEEQFEEINQSPKFVLLFAIISKCEEIGDKLLVFSQSLYTLNLIEYFLSRIDEDTQLNTKSPGLCGYSGSWTKGLDYFRLDGQTASETRSAFIKSFNREENSRARLFLISTRAGGLGINLIGANRVVLFDASWNPSDDVQSIFRTYRFGQKKPCYIYRFLSQGTMEEKIYDRQVAKLSMSCRVVDEQQIDRHFSHSDLTELYSFTPNNLNSDKPTPNLPKDRLMAELLQTFGDVIWNHHQHDSLLDHVEEEELNEEERQLAWQDFENEKNAPPPPEFSQFNPYASIIQKLRLQKPGFTEAQLQASAKEIFNHYRVMYAGAAALNNASNAAMMGQQQAGLYSNYGAMNTTRGRMPVFNPVTQKYELPNALINQNSVIQYNAGPSQANFFQRSAGHQGNPVFPTSRVPNPNKPLPTIDPVVHELD